MEHSPSWYLVISFFELWSVSRVQLIQVSFTLSHHPAPAIVSICVYWLATWQSLQAQYPLWNDMKGSLSWQLHLVRTYLANVSTRRSGPPPLHLPWDGTRASSWNVGKISCYQVYQVKLSRKRTFHHFTSTEATEKSTMEGKNLKELVMCRTSTFWLFVDMVLN